MIVNILLIEAFSRINTLNSLYFLIKCGTDLLLKHCLSLSNRGKNIAAHRNHRVIVMVQAG